MKKCPTLLKKRQEQGLTILPVVVEPCNWKYVKWLSGMNLITANGQSLSECRNQESLLVSIVDKIAETMGVEPG
jgi:hypothetical protein